MCVPLTSVVLLKEMKLDLQIV